MFSTDYFRENERLEETNPQQGWQGGGGVRILNAIAHCDLPVN